MKPARRRRRADRVANAAENASMLSDVLEGLGTLWRILTFPVRFVARLFDDL